MQSVLDDDSPSRQLKLGTPILKNIKLEPADNCADITDNLTNVKNEIIDDSINIGKEFLYSERNDLLFNVVKEEIEIADEYFSEEDKNSNSKSNICCNKNVYKPDIKSTKNGKKIRINEQNQTDQSKINKFPCLLCPKTYKHKSHANQHMKYECPMQNKNKLKKLQCKVCGYYFTSRYTLNRHQFYKHKDPVPEYAFKCNNCDRKYRDKTSWTRHVLHECGKKPTFRCAHCNYCSLQKANLIRHFQRLHSDELNLNKVKCPQCKKIYKNKCSLKRHRKFECGKEPLFTCDYCNRKTKRKCTLLVHIKAKHLRNK